MWLSEKMSVASQNDFAQMGTVTIGGDDMEISSTAVCTNAQVYAPYGYKFSVPAGEDVLLIPSSSGYASAGVKMQRCDLQTGEISISSLGGAYITLKNDGSIIINGLVINKDGEIKQ